MPSRRFFCESITNSVNRLNIVGASRKFFSQTTEVHIDGAVGNRIFVPVPKKAEGTRASVLPVSKDTS